jgi:hypothetical protein
MSYSSFNEHRMRRAMEWEDEPINTSPELTEQFDRVATKLN